MRVSVLSIVAIVACASACPATTDAGSEAAPCYPNGTCNEGLTCASDVCVRIEKANGWGRGPC